MKQLACIVILASFGIAVCQDAPEDVWTRSLFETLGKNADVVIREFAKIAPHQEQELQYMLVKVSMTDNGTLPDESVGCKGCQLIVTVLGYLVKMGYTMEQMREPAITICKLLFTLQNGLLQPDPGNKVCPGVIDNFGPHVESIMRMNRLLPEESCFHILLCSNDMPTFELPPLSELLPLLGRSSDNKKRYELPMARVHNYRTKRRVSPKRNWQKDEDILRVAQFTDIHVDEHYSEGGPTECGMPLCCRELPEGWRGPQEGSAGPYGELNCNVPPSTTLKFLEKTNSLNPNIVLYSGDSPPHHLWEETLDIQMNVTIWVAEHLNDYFTGATGIYSTLGNHECFPSNMYFPDHEDTQVLHDTFIGSYQELSNLGEEQLATINKAGYYSVGISEGLRIVALNSNFGYTANWYNLIHYHGNLYNEMITWMDQTLAKAREDGEKVIMLSHHPAQRNIRAYDEDIQARMVAYGDIIILNVVGHSHIDEFRVFRDESGTGKGVQFLSQSANSYSRVNPGVRMYYFDKNTYQLLGYEQYYLNITHREGTAEVAMLYKTDDEYGLEDLSADSMLDFAARMETDDGLFQTFYKNRVTGAGTEGNCDDSCRTQTLCRQVTATDEDQSRCQDGDSPGTNPPGPGTNPPDPGTQTPPALTTAGASTFQNYIIAHIVSFILIALLR